MNDFYVSPAKPDEIYHYGIKRRSGRYPWGSGNRPYQDEIVKKGTTVSRLSLTENENVKNVRKYVSISEIPEETWMRIMKDGYSKMGYEYLYSKKYQTVRDMKIASVEAAKEGFDKWYKKNQKALDVLIPIMVEDHRQATGTRITGDQKEDFFRQLGMTNTVNEAYLKYMKSKGYDGMKDVFGIKSGGDKSVIIFDPDNTLNLKEQYRIKL